MALMTGQELNKKAHTFIESFGMKLIARAIMPVLISVVGFLIAETLQNINQSIKDIRTEMAGNNSQLWSAQRATATALSATTSKLEVLYERVTQNKVWTDEADKRHSESIEGLNKRLDDIVKKH
jgi:hypothetical protein